MLGIPQQDESQLGGWSDFRAELMDGWMNDGGRGRRDRRCCVTMAAGEKGSEKEREREREREWILEEEDEEGEKRG